MPLIRPTKSKSKQTAAEDELPIRAGRCREADVKLMSAGHEAQRNERVEKTQQRQQHHHYRPHRLLSRPSFSYVFKKSAQV